MKLVWEDVYSIFDDASLWENGHDMYWYRLMWGLMEYKNMNVYSTEADKVKVVSRAFAIIKIYREFINRCFDDEDIAESFDSASDDIMNCLYDDDDIYDIFTALYEELGILRTFYSLFITCIEFRDGQISYADEENYDDYDGEYDEYEYDCEFDEEEDYHLYDNDRLIKDSEPEIPEECSEDFYYSFDSYLKVLATSTMSLVNDFTPEKAAGYIYIARNMKR